jgi:hypothetical protein
VLPSSVTPGNSPWEPKRISYLQFLFLSYTNVYKNNDEINFAVIKIAQSYSIFNILN